MRIYPKSKRFINSNTQRYSKYNQSETNKHTTKIEFYLTEELKKRLVLASRFHDNKIFKDFVVDSAIIMADKILAEHPEAEEELYRHPEMYHPKEGQPNIFKPTMIKFKIKRVKDGATINTTDTSKVS